MTPEEQQAVRELMVQTAKDSMNDGIRAAAQMIRLAEKTRSHWKLSELADAVEATADAPSNG